MDHGCLHCIYVVPVLVVCAVATIYLTLSIRLILKFRGTSEFSKNIWTKENLACNDLDNLKFQRNIDNLIVFYLNLFKISNNLYFVVIILYWNNFKNSDSAILNRVWLNRINYLIFLFFLKVSMLVYFIYWKAMGIFNRIRIFQLFSKRFDLFSRN